MSREKVRLGDIAEFSNGINFGKDDYGKGIKIIGVSNFGDKFSPEYDSLTEVKEEVVKSNDYLYPGDIVFVRSNGNKELVGRCMLIDNKADKVTYSGFCIRARLKDTTKHNPTFWTYYFKNQSFRKAMAGTAVGANIQNLSQGRLADYVTTVPDYDSQVRIAQWLSVYDNLIEKNKKQIKLLEEAAERLYREWFVDLHFPGCEDVKIVDGVPKGWLDGTVGNIALFKRGKTITKAQIHKGNVPVVAGGLEPAYYHNVANTVAPVITISGSGANAGFARLYNVDVFASDCSFVDSQTTPYLFWVYCFIKDSKAKLDSLQKGAAQPHVYAKDINALKIYIPTDDILDRFCKVVAPYFGKIKNLQRQNDLLLQARDRLLPRLMSGEVEV